MKTENSSRYLRRLLVCGFVLAAVVAGFAFRGFLLPPVARFLDVSSAAPGQLRDVDFVVALPGDDNTRTLTAAALVRRGIARRVAVLQGVPSPREADGLIPAGSEITRRVLIVRGIDEDDIVMLPGESASTLTDTQLLAPLWSERPQASVVIVSNGYHLRRARWSVHRALPEHAHKVAYVAAPLEAFDETDWWRSEEGISSVLSEYFKLNFYIIRYGSLAQRAALAAVPLLMVAAVAVRRVKSDG